MKYFFDADEVLWYNISQRDFWLSSASIDTINSLMLEGELVLDRDLLNFLDTKGPEDLFIVSINHKDRLDFVMEYFNLYNYFSKDNISSDMTKKGERIKNFIERDNIDPKHAVFVDDRESNLCEVKSRLEDINLIMLNRYEKIRKKKICSKYSIPVINSIYSLI